MENNRFQSIDFNKPTASPYFFRMIIESWIYEPENKGVRRILWLGKNQVTKKFSEYHGKVRVGEKLVEALLREIREMKLPQLYDIIKVYDEGLEDFDKYGSKLPKITVRINTVFFKPTESEMEWYVKNNYNIVPSPVSITEQNDPVVQKDEFEVVYLSFIDKFLPGQIWSHKNQYELTGKETVKIICCAVVNNLPVIVYRQDNIPVPKIPGLEDKVIFGTSLAMEYEDFNRWVLELVRTEPLTSPELQDVISWKSVVQEELHVGLTKP